MSGHTLPGNSRWSIAPGLKEAPDIPMSHAQQRILTAAAILFGEKGYDRTSTAQIAEQAGVANGSLFHAFPNKPAIREELIRQARQSYAAAIAAAIATAKARLVRFEKLLLALIDGHLAWVEANTTLSKTLYDLAPAIWVFGVDGHPPEPLQPVFANLCETFNESIRRGAPGSALVAVVFGPAEMASRAWLREPRLGSPRMMVNAFVAAAEAGFIHIKTSGLKMPVTASAALPPPSKKRQRKSTQPTEPDDRQPGLGV